MTMRVITLALLLISLAVAWTRLAGTPVRAAGPASRVQAGVFAFSEPGAGAGPALSLIRLARHSIRLEVYMLTDREVEAALGAARRRGVSVRVMLEEHPFGGGSYAEEAYSRLRAENVTVRWANETAFTYTHEKAMVVDGRLAGIFTFNLTGSGFSRNREFGVIDRSSADARTLATVFDADWARRPVRIGRTRLVLSPSNARSDLDSLINSAHHTLDLYAEEVADSGMENRLIAARNRHVRVRLITSSDSAGVEELRRAGIGVTVLSSPYIHAKAIVADGRRVFIGSENFSSTSLDRNREAGIILSDRATVSVVERTFAADWHGTIPSSVPPPPAPTAGQPASSRGALSVHVTVSPDVVSRGQALTVEAMTAPSASCGIRITYPDGYVSRASALQGLRTAIGGRAGRFQATVSWSWHVGSTAIGTAQATVRCTLGGRSGSGVASFEIRQGGTERV